jgi:hypothetical protein
MNILVPEPRAFEVEMVIEKLKRHTSPGIDQIPAEMIKEAVGQYCMRSIDINSVWNKEELPQEWKESTNAPVYKKG